MQDNDPVRQQQVIGKLVEEVRSDRAQKIVDAAVKDLGLTPVAKENEQKNGEDNDYSYGLGQ